jgi:FkbM family methyltransferase
MDAPIRRSRLTRIVPRSVRRRLDVRFVRSAYRAVLAREPTPDERRILLSRLGRDLAWEDLIRSLIDSDASRHGQRRLSQDLFEVLVEVLPELIATDADLTVPLETYEVVTGRPLALRGSVRDEGLFQPLIRTRGEVQRQLALLMLGILRPGDGFVDGGANIGYFSSLGSHAVGPTGRVVAFEPATRTRGFLEQNVAGLGNVVVLPYALWDRRTTLPFVTPHAVQSGAHLITGQRDSDQAAGVVEQVACVPLDDLLASGELELPSCRLVKLDTEGTESTVLDGMQAMLAAHRPIVIAEVSPPLLRSFGSSETGLWDRLTEHADVVYAAPFPGFEDRLGGTERAVERFGVPLWPVRSRPHLTDIAGAFSDVSGALDLVAIPAAGDAGSGASRCSRAADQIGRSHADHEPV